MLDLVLLGVRGLKRQKVRSLLTLLGIVIGVATVFTLVSISMGSTKFLEEQFEKFGADKVIVLPGGTETSLLSAFSGRPFGEEELRALEKIPGVEYAAGVGYLAMDVRYGDKVLVTMVTGAPVEDFEKLFEDVQGYELERGRYPRKGRKEAVLGYLIAKKGFGREVHVGAFIYIRGERFRVVGIMKEVGNRVDDTAVIIPLDVFEELTGREKTYDMIFAKVSGDIERVAERIRRKLMLLRGAEDFTVMTSRQLFERVMSILGAMSLVLIIIAAVSLVVGAVGIMNTMYMSVTERTKEIGILKAIGATRGQILVVFLTESALLGLLGGLAGILLGAVASVAAESIARSAGAVMFRAYVGPDLVAGALLLSLLTGVIAGLLPAKRAADLDPVEALRYE